MEFQKTNVVFEISTLAFVNMQRFIQKQTKFNKNYYQIFNQYSRICETIKFHPKHKKNKLSTKNALLYLSTGIFRNYCHICNQCTPICLIAKFREKIRIHKFGTINALFKCFGEQFRKTIVLFIISAFKFVKLQNLVKKWKCLILGPKCIIWVFWDKKFKNLLSYLKSVPLNLTNCEISWKNENA